MCRAPRATCSSASSVPTSQLVCPDFLVDRANRQPLLATNAKFLIMSRPGIGSLDKYALPQPPGAWQRMGESLTNSCSWLTGDIINLMRTSAVLFAG
jgi:hypothetical protein